MSARRWHRDSAAESYESKRAVENEVFVPGGLTEGSDSTELAEVLARRAWDV